MIEIRHHALTAEKVDMKYVTYSSPFRVSIAHLAEAHAALADEAK